MSSPKPDLEATAIAKADPKMAETDKLVDHIATLAGCQCTESEAAALLGFTPEEFRAFLIRNERSFRAWFSGPDAGKAQLRAMQFKAARKGNARMLVWLGKQYLNQSDNPEPTYPPENPQARSDWDDLASWRMPRH